jgi:ABC-type multidrug transport system ATPase subunit/pSer/pThr/pTyr-binding forkhead associated (FHA) protein
MVDSSNRAVLTIQAGPDSGKTVQLSEAELIIGRTPPADLVINQAEVSRRHARIFFQNGQYFLEDLGSSNGTVVNGSAVTAAVALNSGDAIGLGSEVQISFRIASQAAAKTDVYPAAGAAAEETIAEPIPGAEPTISDMPMAAAETSAEAAPGPEQMASGGETMIETDLDKVLGQAAGAKVPPVLAVTIAGQESREYTLTKGNITIGRADDNDIVVPSQIVSRHHASLSRTPNGYEVIIGDRVTNTLSVQGRPVTDRKLLAHGDVLRIDSDIPGMMVTMSYSSPSEAAVGGSLQVQFGEKDKLTFGRDAGNDVVLDVPIVSRFHAQITRVGRRYLIQDLRSANGTFVNDQRVQGDVWLNPQDTVRIGPYRFVLGQDQLSRYDETEGVRVEAYHLNKWVRKDLNLLQDISLIYQPREFIVVVGQSGGGKSTLVDAIAGYRPATDGKVFVNAVDVYRNFDAIRNQLGYVPQRDIIHMELTVYQALDFAAQLRMPKDTTKEERHKRISEVLDELDLAHRKDIQVSGLSGGQQKRVSIGVELLTRPGLFFLDEPTSGLDPGTETAFMHLMRRLADQGRTIIMVTHATKNVMLADKVVFLARGGHLAWFGPPDEALAFFDEYRSESERRVKPMEFDQIYAILDDPIKGKPEEWAARYKASSAFQRYVVQPLTAANQQILAAQAQPAKKEARKAPRVSSLRQFLVLSARNVTILTRDRTSLMLMLLIPPLVGSLDILLGFVMGRDMFSFTNGDSANAGVTLFLMTIYALLVGAMSQMREFVKEGDIYKRERLVNLRIFPYVISKVWVAMLLAFYQALCYTVLHYVGFRMPGGAFDFGLVYITMVFAVMTGMMLGLLASAISPNASSVPLLIIGLIIPLIVLSGVLAPVPGWLSQVASTRWAWEGLMGISGMGSNVSADACWELTPELQSAMTLEDKAANNCRCMGVQMFNQSNCNYPGLGKLSVAELNQDPPVRPTDLPPEPQSPTFPAPPTPPADNTNQVEISQYLNALVAYQQQTQDIGDEAKNQGDLYRAMAAVYQGQMAQYQEAFTKYTGTRFAAVAAGEGIIAGTKKLQGWAWVNKDDPSVFYPWLAGVWSAQVWIMLVYFLLILWFIKRKDVK